MGIEWEGESRGENGGGHRRGGWNAIGWME